MTTRFATMTACVVMASVGTALADPMPALDELRTTITSGVFAKMPTIIGSLKCSTEQGGSIPFGSNGLPDLSLGVVTRCSPTGKPEVHSGGIVKFKMGDVAVTAVADRISIACRDGSKCLTIATDRANPQSGEQLATWTFDAVKQGFGTRLAAAFEPAKAELLKTITDRSEERRVGKECA